MSRPAPVEGRMATMGAGAEELRAASLLRRRVAAARVRRRRLLLADLGVAAVIALLALILAPGLAIVALGAVVVLAVCGSWLAGGRLRAWRAQRRVAAGAPDERGPRAPADRRRVL